MIEERYHISEIVKPLSISSDAFKDRGYIPAKYSCDGENINPPLSIGNIPKETKSLALIVDDPDAPIRTWVHWIVWNIPPAKKIKENEIAGDEGVNDFGNNSYGGPCPPSGTHNYIFKVYALDELLDLNPSATKIELEKAMAPHIIGFGKLVGLYKRTG